MKSDLNTIGIVGGGQMGRGIAQVCAHAGYTVRIFDTNEAQLVLALEEIRKSLQKAANKEGGLPSVDTVMGRLETVPELSALHDCDFVIESATENEAVKREILRDLSKIVKPDAYFATNTSSISITRLASCTDRPAKFIGMHFMNPVPLIPLVEVIRGLATSQETFEFVSALTQKLEKTTAIAEDFPAFIVNRILMPMINESIYVLYEGVGNVEAIDRAMTLGTRHPMGPLSLADFIGLDTCLAIMQVLYEGLADSKYRPCPLLVKYVEAGWLGRKSGRGFYDYSTDTPVPTR